MLRSWIIYGNLWISAGAAALAYSTILLHRQAAGINLLFLVFFACLFIYNYHRIFRLKEIYAVEQSDRHRWIVAHNRQLTFLTIIAGICTLVFMGVCFSRFLFISAIPFFMIALLYVIPLYKKNGVWRRLRDIPYLKVLLIALVWTYATVVVPLSGKGLDLLNEPVFWLTSVQRFLFILAIALPFDVRDLNRDKAFDVITAAGSLGLNRLKRLCHLLLSAMLLVVLAGILMNLYQPAPATGMLISVLGTGWLINKLELNNSEFYFTVLLDGTLIDQLFWVWLMGLTA